MCVCLAGACVLQELFWYIGASFAQLHPAMPFAEIGVVEGVAVCGGYLKDPVWVPREEHAGVFYLRVRSYDDWLHWMVCSQSRKARPFRESQMWSQLLDEKPDNEPDPMADIVDDIQVSGQRKRARQRVPHQCGPTVREVECTRPGTDCTRILAILAHGKSQTKKTQQGRSIRETIWLRQSDLPWFVESLHLEHHNTVPEVAITGVRWIAGTSKWVANWATENGDKKQQFMHVVPWVQQAGMRIPLEEAEFQEKKRQKKEELLKKIAAMGFVG